AIYTISDNMLRLTLRTRLGGTTAEDGSFRLTSLEPDSYRVSASRSHRNLGVVDNVEVVGTRITEGVQIRLPCDACLQGRVTDGSGRPVAGAGLVVQSEEPVPEEITGRPEPSVTRP